MSRRQAPKSGWHPRQNTNLGRLERTLRRQWKSEHSAVTPNKPVALVEDPEHMARARAFELPADFDPDALPTRTFHRYLDVRAAITHEQLDKAKKGLVKFVDQAVFVEFVPDEALAPQQDLLDVARGIAVAKVAIRRTQEV